MSESGPSGHAYLVSAARTPIGKLGGALAGVPATTAGRRRHSRCGGARRPGPGDRGDRRRPDGPGPPGGGRPGAGAPGRARGRTPGSDPGHDDQPGLRLRPQGDHAGRRRDPGRRRRARRGRWHGEHERGALPAARGALRLPARERRGGRLDGRRRPLVRSRGLPHGHPRRARRDPRAGEPRRPGCLCPREPPASGGRPGRGPIRRRDGSRRRARREGPRDGGRR